MVSYIVNSYAMSRSYNIVSDIMSVSMEILGWAISYLMKCDIADGLCYISSYSALN